MVCMKTWKTWESRISEIVCVGCLPATVVGFRFQNTGIVSLKGQQQKFGLSFQVLGTLLPISEEVLYEEWH